MKYKLYTIPLLQQKILFVFCNGDKEFIKIQNKKEVKDWLIKWTNEPLVVGDSMGACLIVTELNKPIILYVRSTLKGSDLDETISHEIMHAIFYLQKMCNFKEENEFTAYLTGVINADFRKFIKSK